MLASGDQVVGALQVGVARSMQSVFVRDLLRHSVVLFGFLGCVLACVVNAVAPAPRQVKQALSGKKPQKPPRMTPRGLHAGGAGALRTCSAAFRSGIGIGTTETYLSNVFIRKGGDWGDGIMEGSGAVHRFQ